MSPLYHNSLTLPGARAPVTAADDLHEATPPANYDLNSIVPVPPVPLETRSVRLEPLIPSLHANALSEAFSTDGEPDDVWFYPFPSGKPYEAYTDTLVYMEKQRRRPNVLPFAIIDKKSGSFAGTMALGCDPSQATLDVKLMGIKVIPRFRGTHVFVDACYLLLAYVLNPQTEGGLGFVRVAWRTPPENVRSQKAAEKLGMSREGIMRCYEVSSGIDLDSTPYPHFRVVPDGTRRVTEDAMVYSMTCYDWLVDGKRDNLKRKIL